MKHTKIAISFFITALFSVANVQAQGYETVPQAYYSQQGTSGLNVAAIDRMLQQDTMIDYRRIVVPAPSEQPRFVVPIQPQQMVQAQPQQAQPQYRAQPEASPRGYQRYGW